VTSAVAFGPLGLDTAGSVWLVGALAVGNAILGLALGLFTSAFARSEFQAVQFLPAFVLPQFLLCGLIVPRGEMAQVLDWISAVLPLTYAYDALHAASTRGDAVGRDVLAIVAWTLAALALGALTLRRRTP
jgi:ABC transporter DrrB family efflux protein